VRTLDALRGAALLSLAVAFPLHAQAGRAAYEAGQRFMQRGEHAQAEQAFQRALAEDDRVAAYHLALGQAIGLQAADASPLRQPFMARRVKGAFERAVALDPTLVPAREGLIQFHINAPAVMGGSLAEARAQAQAIARLDAARGHLASATIAWQARDTVATERALRAAVAAAPDSLAPVLSLTNRLLSWGRTDAAWAALDAYAARRASALVQYHIGRLAGITGQRLERGERALRDVLEARPADSTGLPGEATLQARLGEVLRKAGRRDEARAAYERALRLQPGLRLATEGLRALR
jgi:tetratricopeptide (TPR) repeat protein